MLIAGAGGHAKEVLGIFSDLNMDNDVVFFDDSVENKKTLLYKLHKT